MDISPYKYIHLRTIAYAHNVDNIPLNPASSMMEPVVQGLFSEMTSIFVDDYFHIGGDEVVYGCWQQDQSLTNWMSRNGIDVRRQTLISIILFSSILWIEINNNYLILSYYIPLSASCPSIGLRWSHAILRELPLGSNDQQIQQTDDRLARSIQRIQSLQLTPS